MISETVIPYFNNYGVKTHDTNKYTILYEREAEP